ncbi:MAG: phosphoenolpyruvate--protein phosphotransferase, partial [Terrimesophilobacter sp.]
MKYRGLGVGLGVVAGPVRRMFNVVPDPVDEVSALSMNDERVRAQEALESVALELESRAKRAGGEA